MIANNNYTNNTIQLKLSSVLLLLLIIPPTLINGFATPSPKLDPVTYLRTEWVSAALCTNQTPKEADKVLQLGIEDGRIVNFVPRTVREIITSSAESKDSPEGGGLTVSCERQLKQMAERRQSGISVTYSNQPSDDLKDTPSSSVDVVVSLQAAQRMDANGLDWKRSIQEAGRVLKPGGRFLFVEAKEVGRANESYLDYVVGLSQRGGVEIKPGLVDEDGGDEGEMMMQASDEDEDDDDAVSRKVFDEVGYDNVDLVLQPHIAGVALKALDAGLTKTEKEMNRKQEESDRLAEISLNAFERGRKKRKRKKKKSKAGVDGEE